ncbi:MAG: hypothetical protein JSS29_14675 [Proteobacteria bacterium]|nr:hypothetical protein [Pseudomonadota bacterium]
MELHAQWLRIQEMISPLNFAWQMSRINPAVLQRIEAEAAGGDPVLAQARADLFKMLSAVDDPDDARVISQAYETFENAQAYIALRDRDLPVRRIGKSAWPTFECKHSLGTFYIEVKSLEFQDRALRRQQIARAVLEARSRQGPAAEGNGAEPRTHSQAILNGSAAGRIDMAIGRIKRDLSLRLITQGPTLVLVDMSEREFDSSGPWSLLPVYYDSKLRSVASGELWLIAFGQPRDQVFIRPSSEGGTNLGGRLSRTGVCTDFGELLGMLFLVRTSDGLPRIFGLLNQQGDDTHSGNALTSTLMGRILASFCDDVNDQRNEGGFGKACR